MAKIQTLSDEELLKRSGRAGWYLMALAAAMTVLAVWMVVVAAMAGAASKPDSAPSDATWMWALAMALPLTMCVITVGLWLLTIAAKRGNPTAPGIVLVVIGIQILFAFIVSCNALLHGIVATTVVYLVIDVVIALTVLDGRTILLEMKQRGVWETSFAAAKPSRRFCLWGGILLIAGYVAFNAGIIVPAYFLAPSATDAPAKAFFECIKSRMPAAVESLQQWTRNTTDAKSLKAAQEKIESLDQKVAAIQRKVAPDLPLAPILTKYRQALFDWKNAMDEFESPDRDMKKVKQYLQSGTKLHSEALGEFNSRYLHR
jgi:hypothetical protein